MSGTTICEIPSNDQLQFQDKDNTILLTVDLLELQLVIEGANDSKEFSGKENLAAYAEAIQKAFDVKLTSTQVWSIVNTCRQRFEELKKKLSI